MIIVVLCIIMAFIGFAIMDVSGRESRWEEMRELDLTDAEETEEGEEQ